MYSIKRTPLAAALLLALNSPLYIPTANATPAPPVPVPATGPVIGSEFLVNTAHTLLSQKSPSVAMDANGDYVVVWQSDQSGSYYGIYAQRYHADGSVNGSELTVSNYSGNETLPSVAMDDSGNFVIAWQDDSGQDGDTKGIRAQRYDATGMKVDTEIQVNTWTTGNQSQPRVAMDATGDFVIAWQSQGQDDPGNSTINGYGIYARQYTSNGTIAGTEFSVNTSTSGNQYNPSVAMDAAGDFVIAWAGNGLQDTLYGIYAQRYNAAGTAAGSEFHVNTTTSSYQDHPSVAMDDAGDFAVTWQSYKNVGSGYDIYAQRYDSTGTASSDGEFQVNTWTTGLQVIPSVAMDATGDFAIAWTSAGQDGSVNGAFARTYNADGTTAVREFLVNSYTTGTQQAPSIAMDTIGNFVVAWQSQGQDDIADSSGYGVYAQRFAGTADLSLVVTDDTDPVTVGNNFVYTLTTTNNGAGTAINVNLSEPLPTDLTYVSDDSASSGWTCSLSVATVTCDKPYMTAGETSTINVTVTADTVTTLSNTVTASSAQTDSNPADNTDTETTVVDAVATTTTTTTPSSGGGGGSLGVFTLLLAIPLWLRRRWLR